VDGAVGPGWILHLLIPRESVVIDDKNRSIMIYEESNERERYDMTEVVCTVNDVNKLRLSDSSLL
jgi:hypothetical protein